MKKRFNANIVLFVFAAVFIVAGLWGKCFTQLKSDTLDMLAAFRQFSFTGAMAARDAIDDDSSDDLSYHDMMMDVDSVRNNLLGTRVVKKDDITVVKADSGSLCAPMWRITDADIETVVSCVQKLKDVSEENGAKFLYCIAPKKEQYEQFPSNSYNYTQDNMDRLLTRLESTDIPTLEIADAFKRYGLADSDIFFNTDHHWRVHSGFLASAAICEELSSRYGFDYNEQYTDLQNYTVTVYPHWFLVSRGKKVGRFFTWSGADDFELITPNFETDMTEEQPFINSVRNGTFEETVLFMQNMKKDYYNGSPYVTYSGGDFRLQIMKNNLNPDGKKILLVRNSYSCVVAPFLALQTSELHVCDMRDFSYFVGEKLNLEEYIKEISPDYVIVLYNGASSFEDGLGQYNFF